jgi:hypothetical protein
MFRDAVATGPSEQEERARNPSNSEVRMYRAPPVLLLLFGLLLGGLSPPGAVAQSEPPSAVVQARGFRLEQNYPNPANPETYIPFSLEASQFVDGGSGVVSMRIVNMLGQLVAIPKAVGHPRGSNVPVLNLRYTEPGRKVAFWDGRDLNGRRVASGVYFCMLQVGEQVDYSRIIVSAPRRRGRFFPFFRRGEN